MKQLQVKYHQLKIDMFALYRATMDSRGVKVFQAEQALNRMSDPAVVEATSNADTVGLPAEDTDYAQSLADMEKRFQLGPCSYRGRSRRLERLPPPAPSTRRRAAELLAEELDGGTTCAEAGGKSSNASPSPPRHWSGRELDRSSRVSVIRCHRCTERFDNSEALYEHWKEHVNCRIICLFCREEFVTNSKHDGHTGICNGIKCSQCFLECASMEEYGLHRCTDPDKCEPTELLNAPLSCPYCQKMFTMFPKLKVHMKQQHETEHLARFGVKVLRKYKPCAPNLPCGQCDRYFDNANALKKHITVHKKATTYQCSVCNKTFRFKTTMERHLKTHREPNFCCEVCGYKFEKGRQLKIHLNKAHRNDSFTCMTCLQECTGYSAYVNHKKRSHTAKCYTCSVCGSRFGQKANFKKHLKSHTNYLAYDCRACNSRFGSRKMLRAHFRQEHPEVKRIPAELPVFCGDSQPSYYGSGDVEDQSDKYSVDGLDGGAPYCDYDRANGDQYQGQQQLQHGELQNGYSLPSDPNCLSNGYNVFTDGNEQLIAQYYTPDGQPVQFPLSLQSRYPQQENTNLMDLSVVAQPGVATLTTYIVPDNVEDHEKFATDRMAPAAWTDGSQVYPTQPSRMPIQLQSDHQGIMTRSSAERLSMPTMELLMSGGGEDGSGSHTLTSAVDTTPDLNGAQCAEMYQSVSSSQVDAHMYTGIQHPVYVSGIGACEPTTADTTMWQPAADTWQQYPSMSAANGPLYQHDPRLQQQNQQTPLMEALAANPMVAALVPQDANVEFVSGSS